MASAMPADPNALMLSDLGEGVHEAACSFMLASGRAELPARTGGAIADWANTPAGEAVIWIGGTIVLIAIVALIVKMKRDSE